ARERRLLAAVPDPLPAAAEVVAVVTGSGNRRLFESLGATQIVEGGQTMNPSAAELVAAVDATDAPEAIVLPNNANIRLAAEQAATPAGGVARGGDSADRWGGAGSCGSARRARTRESGSGDRGSRRRPAELPAARVGRVDR